MRVQYKSVQPNLVTKHTSIHRSSSSVLNRVPVLTSESFGTWLQMKLGHPLVVFRLSASTVKRFSTGSVTLDAISGFPSLPSPVAANVPSLLFLVVI